MAWANQLWGTAPAHAAGSVTPLSAKAPFAKNCAQTIEPAAHLETPHRSTNRSAHQAKMVAGVKGSPSSTTTPWPSRAARPASSSSCPEAAEGPQKIPLGDGVKAESLACVPKTRKVLVVDAKGHLCEVDCETDQVQRVASAGHHQTPPRLTSVCAWDSKTCFVAGAERGKKTKCACWRVDLETNKVDEAPVLEANMIRALCAERERDRILIGCLDVEGDDYSPEVENARTRLMAYYPKDGTTTQLASIQGFVHAIAPLHRRKDEAYALLMRHRKGGAPVKVIRLLPKGQHVQVWSKCSVQHTVHVCGDKLATGLAGLSLAGFSASLFGSAAGREHAVPRPRRPPRDGLRP